MEVTERHVFALDDPSRAGEARRTATTLATRLGASQADAGRIALVVTEATTNVVKHAEGGQLLLYGSQADGAWSVGMIALDRGPGMRDLRACFEDGMSTAGTAGTGLGAIRRLSTTFDAYTSDAGTVVFAEIDGPMPARRAAGPKFAIGAVRVPHPREEVCGDDVAVMPMGEGRCMILVVDGLGHGLGAAAAAEEATRLFRAHPAAGPEAVMTMLHDGLRGTRGAAAAVADVDARTRTVRFAGVGNIAGCVRAEGRSHGMISHHGTLGHQAQRMHEFRYPWPEHALVVLHSDGVSARWDLASYPGLAEHHPMVIAAVLYRDHARRTDDASIVVVREAA
jgi:anti-sigma regulatory factor (Ser/Thr protein kinase)